jgi:alpha-tubulin suppressor-like RCC1 family protein
VKKLNSIFVVRLFFPTVIYAWGDGEFGKLGLGQLTGTKVPTRLTTIRGDRIIAVSAGSHNSAFIGGNRFFSKFNSIILV